VDRKLI
jgi:WD40 repeat protein